MLAQKILFEDLVRAMFLLVTLNESWDTFKKAISPEGELTSVDVESSLLITEEVNKNNTIGTKGSSALIVRWRSHARRKSHER